MAYSVSLQTIVTELQSKICGLDEIPRDIEVVMADITTITVFLQQDFQIAFDMFIYNTSRERIAGFCRSLLGVIEEFASKEGMVSPVYHLDRKVIYDKLYAMFTVVLDNSNVSQRDALFIVYLCSKYEQVLAYMYDLYKLFESVQLMFSKEPFSITDCVQYGEDYGAYSNLCVLVLEENDIRNITILPSWYDKDIDDYLVTLL